MTSLSFRFTGHQRVKNSLRRLASDFRKETDSTIEKWVKIRQSELKPAGYPAPKRGPQPFKTVKQRKWFFWALRTGQIEVPYRRTGRLANSWRVRKLDQSDWVLENTQEYSSWVIGNIDEQSFYHKGTWWIAAEEIKQHTPVLTKKLTSDLIGLTK